MLRVGGEWLFAESHLDIQLLWAVAVLYACCALLRLARYNVETEQGGDHNTFQGLPTPAAAVGICGLILGGVWFTLTIDGFREGLMEHVLRVVILSGAAVIGLLMVSRVRYQHLFNRLVTRSQSLRTVVILLILVIAVIVLREHWMLLVPVFILPYIASGPLYFGYRFLRGRGLLGRRQAVAERKRRRKEGIPAHGGKDSDGRAAS
jgi:CDP-diacylglycerol---serine O-phosphatidyltransferase